MSEQADYYSLLGLDPAASAEEIKKAYRKLVFRYHPDRNPDDAKAAETFKGVLTAYQVLSDNDRRVEYDRANGFARKSNAGADGNRDDGFQFSYDFKGKTEPEPQCPNCSVSGVEHVVSRKGGAGSGRGKQFVLSPFMIIFCSQCGHVYGVAGSQS